MTLTTRTIANAADLELEQRVAEHMAPLKHSALSEIKIVARRRVVTLRGYVSNGYEREMARQSARAVRGVAAVVDELAIREAGPAPKKVSSAAAFLREIDGQFPVARHLIGPVVASLLIVAGILFWNRAADDRLPVFPAQGHITFEGQPIADALIVFHPKGATKDSPRPMGKVDKNGAFTLTTYNTGDGAPPGEYIVTAEWRPMVVRGGEAIMGPNLLPAKYGSPNNSTIRAQVTDGRNEFSCFSLSR